jgi:hypothetical protein
MLSMEHPSLETLLIQQNTLLAALLEELKAHKNTLGFGPAPKPIFVYCNRSNHCLWYTLSEDSQRTVQPILQDALTGIVTKIEPVEATRRGKTVEKLHVHVKVDSQRKYILEAGLDSIFAKGLLYTLSLIPVEKLKLPITIAVEAGETDEVLFCKIYNPVTGEMAFAPWDASTQWDQVLQRAMSKVELAHSREGNPS